jgi:hypothetical protein
MSSEFHVFAKAAHDRLQRISKEEMYTVEVVDIAASYLAAFPEGTNPIFKTRTEHDCSCCKQFIRNFGRTFAIIDGRRVTVWGGLDALPSPYKEVAARMDALIQQAPIQGVFRTKEGSFGAQQTVQMVGEHAHVWHHFHGKVAARHHSHRPDEAKGEKAATAQVLRRGLKELSLNAIDTVIDLINDGNLYRGQEFLASVKAFRELKVAYEGSPDPELMVWSSLDKPAARVRNTAIGTLLQDLSEGLDVEQAVRKFESVVAPTNYRRPKALITPKMVDGALKTLADLGLESAIERRFARLTDISVNDVLFVDSGARSQMKDSLRGALMSVAKETPRKATGEGIGIEEFVGRILPGAQSLSLHLKNAHLGNFMSLTAPQHADAGRIFRWNNGYAWTYDGDVTDSIKERVKRAGGNTNAALRVSLAWSNLDDLDIHCNGPDGHIFYGDRKDVLDVDMNAYGPRSKTPVENLSWTKPKDGRYSISVNNFNKRETSDVGFTIEVECRGVVQQFSRRTSPGRGATVKCIEFTMDNGVMKDVWVNKDLHGGSISSDKWGVKTESQVRVMTLLASPNHWDGAGGVGAKHWFFILEGAKNPEAARGIYNEFLRPDLDQHRKVFEVLGAKTKCPPDDQQLSGVGFTAGRGDTVMVTVDGARTYEIAF